MEGDYCPRTTVIAVYRGPCIGKFLRHRLSPNGAIQIPKLCLHIGHGFATYRTTVRASCVFSEALVVYTMTTFHENNSFRRREHIFSAYWTVALGRTLDAAMGIFDRYVNTNGASLLNVRTTNADQEIGLGSYLAMEKVFTKTLSSSADSTITAVIYTLFRIVIPKLANRAIIRRG